MQFVSFDTDSAIHSVPELPDTIQVREARYIANELLHEAVQETLKAIVKAIEDS